MKQRKEEMDIVLIVISESHSLSLSHTHKAHTFTQTQLQANTIRPKDRLRGRERTCFLVMYKHVMNAGECVSAACFVVVNAFLILIEECENREEEKYEKLEGKANQINWAYS